MNKRTRKTRVCVPMMAAIALSVTGIAAEGQAQDLTETIAEAAGIPQIPAFLPDQYSVARSEALPIDGVWMVSTIRKKIRIEQGRAYAVDPWLHMFVLKVQPGMVVMQNLRRTGPGEYVADDLPLVGPAEMTLTANGNLEATVKGMFGPVRYKLVRLEAQYPDALTAEVQAATGAMISPPSPVAPLPSMPPTPAPVQPLPQPAPAPAPVEPPANCRAIGIDPDTGETICA